MDRKERQRDAWRKPGGKTDIPAHLQASTRLPVLLKKKHNKTTFCLNAAFELKTALELVVSLEALLLHHARDLIVAERREINTLLLAAVVVKNEKIRVRALDPADVNVLVQLKSLLVLQPPSYIVKLVQLSAGARLETSLRALGRHEATLLQDAAAVLAVPIFAVLCRARGLRGGQRRQSQVRDPHSATLEPK